MYKLSAREQDVLYYITKGYNNTQIGDALSISKHTAKSHASAIMRKMEINSRTEAAYLAGKFNLC